LSIWAELALSLSSDALCCLLLSVDDALSWSSWRFTVASSCSSAFLPAATQIRRVNGRDDDVASAERTGDELLALVLERGKGLAVLLHLVLQTEK
jgi:hypothetical protein